MQCYRASGFTFGKRTTNRLECRNSKVKSVHSRYTDLSTFFNQFFVLLSCLRNERDHTSLMALIKKHASNLALGPSQEQYAKLVTPYALSFIEKQLSFCDRVKFSEHFTTGCAKESSECSLSMSSQECHCTFWKSTKLPCQHNLRLKRFATFLSKVLTNVGQCLTSEIHHNKKEYTSRGLKFFSGTCRYNYLNNRLILYNVHCLD